MTNSNANTQSNVRTIKAASWYTISNFIAKCMLYLFTPLYTRVLTEAQYGMYNNYLSWQSIFVAVLSLDLASSVAIAYVDHKKKEEFHDYISTITFLSAAIPLVFSVIILMFRDFFSELLSLEPLYIVLLLINVCTTSALQIFQAEQRSKVEYKLSSALTLGTSFGSMVMTLLFVTVFPDKLLAVILGAIAVNTVVNLAIIAFVFKRRFCINKEYAKYAFLIALPLVPHVLAGTLLDSSNKIIITKLCGSEDTALYSLINTCAMVVTLFVTSVNGAWVPWFFGQMEKKAYATIQKVVKITIPMIALVALALCLVAPEVVLILGSQSYAESVFLMPPMILTCVVRYVYSLYVNIEFYNKKTGGISVATAIAAAVNIGLNLVVIRFFGYVAAAYTTLLANVLMLVLHMGMVKRQGMWHVFNNKYNVLALCAASAVCFSVLLLYRIPMVRYGVIGVLALAAVVVLVKFRKEIFVLLKKLMKR